MVDKENQWEETYNSEDMEDQDEYSSEELEDDTYSDDEYDEDGAEEEYDEDDDYQNAPKKSGNAVLILLVILLLLIAGAVFMVLPKLKNSQVQTADNGQQNQIEATQDSSMGLEFSNSEQENGENAQNNTQDMGDKFFEQAGGNSTDLMSIDFNNADGNGVNVTTNGENGEIVANVTPATQSNKNTTDDDLFAQGDLNTPGKNNDTIMISYNPTSRANPFKPPVISPKEDKSYELLNTTDFEIIEPPAASEPDANLTMLLQTQISGILYDEKSPSAIVKLNGKDQFVKEGDVISGYKVQSITKDKVLISYKSNSYVASVGQLFTKGELEKKPAVANLENKFAGRYKNN